MKQARPFDKIAAFPQSLSPYLASRNAGRFFLHPSPHAFYGSVVALIRDKNMSPHISILKRGPSPTYGNDEYKHYACNAE